MEIKELTTPEELSESFEVMKELRTHLDKEEFLSLYEKMKEEGYRIYGLYDNGTLYSVAGVIILTNFYYFRHLFVYDLVTRETGRSKGYGKRLLEYLEQFAAENHCVTVALESGLQREDAHRFYDRENYDRKSFAFAKKL